jgi:hypothetical protein
MFCGACGAAFAPDAKFCGNCGAPRSGIVSRPPPGAPPISPAPSSLPLAAPFAPPIAQATVERKSPLLAAVLECLVPGVGLMYAGGGCSGAFAMASSFAIGGLLLLNGLAMAPHTRPAGMLRYALVVLSLALVWLAIRAVWAALVAHRYNDRLPSPAQGMPQLMPTTQYFGAPGPR